MKLKYVPGMRPTPMLMYYNTNDIEVFNDRNNIFKKGEYISSGHHMWNMGAYLIYNDFLEIVSYRISNPHNFIWLLRIINKEIIVDFDNDFVEKNHDFLSQISDELIRM